MLLTTLPPIDVVGFVHRDNPSFVKIILDSCYVPIDSDDLEYFVQDSLVAAFKGFLSVSCLQVFLLANVLAHGYQLKVRLKAAFESRTIKISARSHPLQAIVVRRSDTFQLLFSEASRPNEPRELFGSGKSPGSNPGCNSTLRGRSSGGNELSTQP